MDFDRQLSWVNILDVFEIQKKVNRRLAIKEDKTRIDRAAVIRRLRSLILETSSITAIAWIFVWGGLD
jgi:hypothetical protein